MDVRSNQFYEKKDVNNVVLGDVTDFGVQSQDVGPQVAHGYTLDTYGNDWYNMVKNYNRTKVDNSDKPEYAYRFQKKDKDNNIINSNWNPVDLYNRTDKNNDDKVSRDYIKHNFFNEPIVIDGVIAPPDDEPDVSFTDYEFVYAQGGIIALIESHTMQLEPEDLTPVVLNS